MESALTRWKWKNKLDGQSTCGCDLWMRFGGYGSMSPTGSFGVSVKSCNNPTGITAKRLDGSQEVEFGSSAACWPLSSVVLQEYEPLI